MKVYVDEIPKCCAECEHCTFNHTKNNGRPFCLIARMPLYNGEEINKDRGQHKDSLSDFDCPLLQLPTDNKWEKLKELVKEKLSYAELLIDPFCGEIEQKIVNFNYDILKFILQKMQELEKEQSDVKD